MVGEPIFIFPGICFEIPFVNAEYVRLDTCLFQQVSNRTYALKNKFSYLTYSLSQQCDISLVVLFLPVFEYSIYDVYKHPFRLIGII